MRRLVIWMGLGVVVSGIAWHLGERTGLLGRGWPWAGGMRLPERLRVEEVVTDLSATFGRSNVLEETAAAPVQLDGIEPHARLHSQGGYRRAIVAPPPSLVRFRTHVPAGAVLQFGFGVEGGGKRDPEAAGVRFAVALGGREVFARVVNPAASRHDRRWFDERIELTADTDREIEVLLATRAAGTGGRLAGKPAWSHVRITRDTWHDRQAASGMAPSVLLLLIDTLRADRLGCYGAAPSPTPTLDRLARQGRLFEQAVAQAPWTLPSVATIFTGVHPPTHGMVGNVAEESGATGDGADDPGYLAAGLRTLAEHAQAAGITTVGVSSNPLVSRGTNLARGFETYIELGWDERRQDWATASVVNDVFLRWVRHNGTYRFLGYLHYMDVHGPYRPPADRRVPAPTGVRPQVASGKVSEIARKLNVGRSRALTSAELEHLRRLYEAQIPAVDAQLAALLDGLSAAGVLESTVLVITSDHGEEFLEHGRLAHGRHLYDETIRIPLVIVGPTVPPGRVPLQAQGIDLFPTVAAVLGLTAPANLPGQDLLGWPRPRPAISEARWRGEEMVSLRTEAWKLIQRPGPKAFELYDLRRDPSERDDRYPGAPEAARLTRQLGELQAKLPLRANPAGRASELRGALRALGYVE